MFAFKYKLILCQLLFMLCFPLAKAQPTKQIDSLKNLLKTENRDTMRIGLQLKIARKYKTVNVDTALLYANKGLSAAEKINYRAGIARGLFDLGYIYLNHENNKALDYFTKSKTVYEKLKNTDMVASALGGMGICEMHLGNYPNSIEYNIESVKLKEKLDNKANLAAGYINLLALYEHVGNYREALRCGFKALRLKEEMNDEDGISMALGNIGTCYYGMGIHDSSLYYNQKALVLRKKFGDIDGIGLCYNNIAADYSELKDDDKALKYLLLSKDIYEKSNDRQQLAMIYGNIGEIQVRKKNYKEALSNIHKALNISRETGAMDDVKNMLHSLSLCYDHLNDMKNAYIYYREFVNVKDSLLNIESTKQIAEIQTKFETTKKEEQIRDLEKNKKIQQLELKNKESDIKKQRTVLFLISAGLLLVLLLAFFVFRGYRQKKKANEALQAAYNIIEEKNHLVEEKQKEILDSIHYAKRIQQALLASKSVLDINLGGMENYFVFFNPKDIVSGDFYWATNAHTREGEELFFLACCDSTGHGVPGAFMSLLNIGFLSEAIKEKDIFKPGDVFNYVRKRLLDSISKEGQKDGFDGILVCINKTLGKISYAAANNSPVIISNNQLAFLHADKMPVGKGELEKPFATHVIEYKKDDTLYLYTDGYADQFGGPKGKKFKYKQLDELLLSVCSESPEDQSKRLAKRFSDWKGNLEQVDDVLVIGIKL